MTWEIDNVGNLLGWDNGRLVIVMLADGTVYRLPGWAE